MKWTANSCQKYSCWPFPLSSEWLAVFSDLNFHVWLVFSILVSISPTFHKQLFCTKDFRAAFLYLQCRFKLFWRKEIGAKAACKMLVKLTRSSRFAAESIAKLVSRPFCSWDIFLFAVETGNILTTSANSLNYLRGNLFLDSAKKKFKQILTLSWKGHR